MPKEPGGSNVRPSRLDGLALEPGEFSPVTETQYGFHVLRLEDRQIVPFEEDRPAVVARVSALIGSIEDTAAGVSIEDARASAIVVPEADLAAINRDFEGSDVAVEHGPG